MPNWDQCGGPEAEGAGGYRRVDRSCSLQCKDPGSMVHVAGPKLTRPLQCTMGGWEGGVPLCARSCPPLAWPANAADCRATTLHVVFDVAGDNRPQGRNGPLLDGWTILPHMPDDYVQRYVAYLDTETNTPSGQSTGNN